MKIKLKNLALFLLLGNAVISFANPVNEKTAKTVAQNFMSQIV